MEKKYPSEPEARSSRFKFAVIQWRNDHLEHCDLQCNVSLGDLLAIAQAAGVKFTKDEISEFLGRGLMKYKD
jgi:hypothetical protein